MEAARGRTDAAIKTLQGVGGVSAKRGKRRTISAAGRKRIAVAQAGALGEGEKSREVRTFDVAMMAKINKAAA